MTAAYDPARTALVLIGPYNDFFADDGKIYPRLREVAEAVGLRQHIRELLAAARAASWPASTGAKAASRTPTSTSSSASTASSTSSWPA
jgi:nicotinamidase-related amidase